MCNFAKIFRGFAPLDSTGGFGDHQTYRHLIFLSRPFNKEKFYKESSSLNSSPLTALGTASSWLKNHEKHDKKCLILPKFSGGFAPCPPPGLCPWTPLGALAAPRPLAILLPTVSLRDTSGRTSGATDVAFGHVRVPPLPRDISLVLLAPPISKPPLHA